MSQHNPELPKAKVFHLDEVIRPAADDFIEHPDPTEPAVPEKETLPVWLYVICGFFLFMAGSSFTGFQYLGLLDQGSGAVTPNSAAVEQVEKPDDPLTVGKNFYGLKCASCHGASGAGQAGQYPPLPKSEYVNGTKDLLLAIMLDGINGHLVVEGSAYDANQMPAWSGESDKNLAAVTTYIRKTWGNSADAIDPSDVADARTKFKSQSEPWNESGLKKVAK